MKIIGQIFILIVAVAISTVYTANAQVSINTDGSDPNASAGLDVDFSDKGFLPPRMTTSQMTAISSPANGLTIYNSDVNALCVYNGSEWDCMDTQSLFNITFICGDNLRDFRDGQSYSTVQIGAQCWMAENINIGTMINGSSNQTNNGTIDKYCYDNNTSNCDTYGGLYQWYEMMKYITTEGTQGICPTGWHIPTDTEWCTLENYVDAGTISCSATGWRGTDVGGNLKETGTTHWYSPNTGATNSSGFTGLPAGAYDYTTGSFTNMMNGNFFWTSSETGTNAWAHRLIYYYATVYRNKYNKAHGLSVRCIQD